MEFLNTVVAVPTVLLVFCCQLPQPASSHPHPTTTAAPSDPVSTEFNDLKRDLVYFFIGCLTTAIVLGAVVVLVHKYGGLSRSNTEGDHEKTEADKKKEAQMTELREMPASGMENKNFIKSEL